MAASSNQPLRWGIIGAGRIGRSAHVPAIRDSGVGDVLAVSSRSKERAEALAREVGAERAYGSYAELLQDPDIDAVYIGLPNGMHEEWCLRSLEAGKHVLCDKSLVYAPAQAIRIAEAARQYGRIAMEGFMYRHHPQWAKAFEILDSGVLGELRLIDAHFVGSLQDETDHRFDPELGRGALYDLTCYAVNVIRYLARAEPRALLGFADWQQPEVDWTTHATLQFEGRLMGTATGSFAGHGLYQQVRVEGSSGRMVIPRPFIPHFDPAEIIVATPGGEQRHTIPGTNHFTEQIRHFTRCTQAGKLLWPAEDGIANARVLSALARSAKKHHQEAC